ncbi:MAG TPA: hypothetical protein VMM38_11810 [Aridibacter sp.]|nr:hypothetical protein [Aridibacter sp.]
MNKLRIKKLGIWSVAKMYGIMALIIGLLIGIPYGLIVIILSLVGASFGGNDALSVGGGGVVMGIILMIGIPVGYAVIGIIGGAAGALIYNLFAALAGRIEIEVEQVT